MEKYGFTVSSGNDRTVSKRSKVRILEPADVINKLSYTMHSVQRHMTIFYQPLFQRSLATQKIVYDIDTQAMVHFYVKTRTLFVLILVGLFDASSGFEPRFCRYLSIHSTHQLCHTAAPVLELFT